MKRLLVPALLTVIASMACARPTGRLVSGDEAPEAFVGQSRLREQFTREGGLWVSPLLAAPEGATRVAAWLSTTDDATEDALGLVARGTREDGTVTTWRLLDERWAEPPQRVLRADFGELVVAIELGVPDESVDALVRAVWSAVTPDPEAAARVDAIHEGALDARAASLVRGALEIDGIEPRSAWDARPDAGCSLNTTKTKITVHHSVSALAEDGSRATHAAAVRGIQSYHMDGRGYCDMGYHFAATADGTVWEGREARFLGAHTGNQNTNNAGIVFVGCFHPSSDCNGLGATTPPQVMIDGGGGAIGRIAAHYGIAISSTTVIGHRDNPGQSTSCPGDHLHELLPDLRAIAADGGVVTPPSTGRVQGTVWDLSITTDATQAQALGARLPGATVGVTGGPSTTARADDAYWSFDLEPGTYTLTATLEGYAPASREVQVTAGGSGWASIGLSPSLDAVSLTVRVLDVEDDQPIQSATVAITGVDPQQTNGSGAVVASVAPGDVTIAVSAEGYEPQTLTRTFAGGATETVDVRMSASTIDPPAGGEGEHEPRVPELVTILPPAEGCGCASADPDESGPRVVLLLALVVLTMSARRRVAFRGANPQRGLTAG